MPKRVLWLLATAVACGAAGIAFASPQFASTFAASFSSQTPHSPSGLDARQEALHDPERKSDANWSRPIAWCKTAADGTK